MRNIFKRKPYKAVECGGFIINFFYKEGDLRRTYMEIKTISDVWSIRIAGNTHTYGYLLTAADKGLTEQIHGYAAMLYILSQQITQDQGLVDDVTKAVKKWQIRMDKKAESISNSVSPFEDMATQVFMEESVRYATASAKERKRIDAKEKEEIKDIINN